MKDRKKYTAPPPFVKDSPAPPVQPTIKIIHTVRETLSPETLAYISEIPLTEKKALLTEYNKKVFIQQQELALSIAMRDALNNAVNTDLEKPHWVRHAAITTLHGEGARMRPCEKLHNGVPCHKPTEWSFDGSPQCVFPKGETPTGAQHAVCLTETGFKKNVTRQERDLAYILSDYGIERKAKK